MAIYEYRCDECEATFTVAESITEHERHRKPPKCPECGGRETRRVFTGFYAQTQSKT